MTGHPPPRSRFPWLAVPALLLLACEEPRAPSSPDRDRLLATTPASAAMQLGVTPLALDARGVPRLVRADGVAPAPAPTATASAMAHLARLAPAWGVADAALPTLQGIGEVPAPGATIARVRQTIDGLPVEGGELRVLVRAGGELVAANGALISADTPRQAAAFPIDDAQAIARAVAHHFRRAFAPAALAVKEQRTDGTRTLRGGQGGGGIDVQLARARKVWHDTGDMLVPAWVVEAYAGDASSTDGDAFRAVLTADGARVLAHESLVADAGYSYRVFAEPTGELHPLDGPVADYSPYPAAAPTGAFPPFTGSALVTVDGMNHPVGPTGPLPPDSWLPPDPLQRTERTETIGNNVEAYSDTNAPTGLTLGDFRAAVTSPRAFDRTYDLTAGALASQAQEMASITSAFYGLNWLHDFWYDAGFTEAAGNGQDSNYGRGGEDRDAMLAETQDNAPNSLNNANMATPSDGMSPRMQIFVWTGKEDRSLTILPANRTPAIGSATFGPFVFDVSAPIVLGVDGVAPVNDGCTPLTNDVAGKLVLVDRGNCTYKTKALNIQTAGGLGMIVANNVAGATPPGMGNDQTITTPITIALESITFEEGGQIKAELGAGEVSGVAHRAVPLLDGGLDSTLLAHEFGHYLHHRLQDCTTAWCRAMSEGWGDFNALMLMIRDGDNYAGAYPFSIYTTQGFSSDPAYFGIRRAPYSASPAINALTYRHMADEVPLPTSHPILTFSSKNSEVHNAGEIWAETMLEVYVALLEAGPSYAPVRAKMARYVVAGLLMAPRNATPTETRDALLAVATPEDRAVMAAAFARRGMGSCAVTPARESTDFVGIVESFAVSGRSTPGAVALAEATSCDHDSVLDAGETAKLSLPLANRGHVPLTDVRVTVTSATPGITVTSAPVTVASLAPGGSTTISAEVALDSAAAGMLEGALTVAIEAADDCQARLDVPFRVRLNVDDVAKASATDAFDADSVWLPSLTSVWSQIGEPAGASALDRVWHGADVSGVMDAKLESPEVTVGDKAPLRVTFTHRYAFEYGSNTAWDGGVIEYSTDGGATWMDVATLAGVVPGYTAVLTAQSHNPLGGRQAFADTNPSYPGTDTVTLDFGTQLAGQSVKLRFRLGTDDASGAEGWDIDDVSFEGITNTPFPAQVDDRTVCVEGKPQDQLPPDELPGCCDAGPIRGGNLALVLGVLALVLRRRRR